ncbi:MAG: hypothetical protein WC414_00375 [Patescibacteria group bacterium]
MGVNEMVMKIQENLQRFPFFFFTTEEILSLGEEKISIIYNHIVNNTLDIFVTIYPNKDEFFSFLQGGGDNEEKKEEEKKIYNHHGFLCPDCGYQDPQRFMTGICPNCGAEIDKNGKTNINKEEEN